MSYGMSMVLGWLWAACILELRAVFLAAGEFAWYVLPWNLLALVWCLVSVQVWRHLMGSCQLMFLGVRSSLESGFGLKPPASSYRSYFYSSFRASPSIQHIDKTSTLKMKSFSTMRVTQRGSQRYMEKRRGRRELEVTRMRWGGINDKVGYPVISSLCALHNWTAQSCSQSYTEKRRRRKLTEVARRINGGNEKEGDRSSQ